MYINCSGVYNNQEVIWMAVHYLTLEEKGVVSAIA
jgi:hypothetical protein